MKDIIISSLILAIFSGCTALNIDTLLTQTLQQKKTPQQPQLIQDNGVCLLEGKNCICEKDAELSTCNIKRILLK